jgi:hypothetical protein
MPIIGTVRKQPSDVQDYDIDFSEWFPSDDVITAVDVSVVPTMDTPPSHAISPDGRVTKVWVYAGGVSGQTYQVTVRATTSDGRVKEVELRVRVKEV